MRCRLRSHPLVLAFVSSLAIAFAVPTPAAAATPQATWAPLPRGDNHPPRLYGHTALYDPIHDRMLVFGGYEQVATNDVWVMERLGPRWSRLATVGPAPAPRSYATTVYDSRRGRMIVFGGRDRTLYYNDVWALSLGDTATWTELRTTGPTPTARYDHAAIYDAANDCMIVYGGFETNELGDIWVLALAGELRWERWHPWAGTAGTPPARSAAAAVYDSIGHRMVLFGGETSSNESLSYDTRVWSLALGTRPIWSRLDSGAGPAGRAWLCGIHDPTRNAMTVFGGYDRESATAYRDVWSFDLARGTWVSVASDLPPNGSVGCAAIYDPPGDRMIVFGGATDTGVSNECWSLAMPAGGTWQLLSPTLPGQYPEPMIAPATVRDTKRNRLLAVGTGGAVWSLDLEETSEWRPVLPHGSADVYPEWHTPVYDPPRDQVVLFDGRAVWRLSLAEPPAWTKLQVAGTGPSWRVRESVVRDADSDRMLVFGGSAPFFDWPVSSFNDLYSLSFGESPSWSRLTPTGPLPPVRNTHAAFYDPVRGRMMILGGYARLFMLATAPLDDAWALSLRGELSWSRLAITNPPLVDRSSAYDAARDRVVAYCGAAGSDSIAALSLADVTWRPLEVAGDPPSRRRDASLIYDGSQNRLLSVGGHGPDMVATEDVWFLNFAELEAIVATVAGVEATPLRVRLRWTVANATPVVGVQKRVGGREWIAAGTVAARASGDVVFEDRGVERGQQLSYRLAFRRGELEQYSGETSVVIPGIPPALRLSVGPNPVLTELRVDIALPGTGPARLELFDVIGRKVLTREVGDLGPGEHAVSFGRGGSFAAGVYTVRLTQDGVSRKTRAIVVR